MRLKVEAVGGNALQTVIRCRTLMVLVAAAVYRRRDREEPLRPVEGSLGGGEKDEGEKACLAS